MSPRSLLDLLSAVLGTAGVGCGALANNRCGTLGCGACPGDQVRGNGGPNPRGGPAGEPAAAATTHGGGPCADLEAAWTARGIDVLDSRAGTLTPRATARAPAGLATPTTRPPARRAKKRPRLRGIQDVFLLQPE